MIFHYLFLFEFCWATLILNKRNVFIALVPKQTFIFKLLSYLASITPIWNALNSRYSVFHSLIQLTIFGGADAGLSLTGCYDGNMWKRRVGQESRTQCKREKMYQRESNYLLWLLAHSTFAACKQRANSCRTFAKKDPVCVCEIQFDNCRLSCRSENQYLV